MEPQGAHRPGREFCPRRLVRGPGGRGGGGGGAGLVGSGWTSGSPLIGSRQVANPNRSGGGYHGLGSAGYEVGMFRWGESSIESEIVRRRWRRLPAVHPLRQTTPNPDACNGRRLANRMGFGRGDGESDGFRHILCQVK